MSSTSSSLTSLLSFTDTFNKAVSSSDVSFGSFFALPYLSSSKRMHTITYSHNFGRHVEKTLRQGIEEI
jgi:hypothetical protein